MKQFSTSSGGALPEPRKTKQKIMQSFDKALNSFNQYRHDRSEEAFVEFEGDLFDLYFYLEPHLQELEEDGKAYVSEIRGLEDRMIKEDTTVYDDDIKEVRKMLKHMNRAIYDLNITNIGVSKEQSNWGQSICNELGVDVPYKRDDFTLDVEAESLGWLRWIVELQNVRKAMRQDRDFVCYVFGGNRMGKSTFALQTSRILENKTNDGSMPKNSIVMDEDDLWDAVERPQYSSKMIDEFINLLYSKESNTSEQISIKKRFVTDATNNQATVGCGTRYFALDREFREDKVDVVVHIPERGKFEVYLSSQMSNIEKDDDTGEAVLPDPEFSGKFPDLDPSDGETDPYWEKYQEREREKITSKDDQEDGIPFDKAVEVVVENEEAFTKVYNKRKYIDADKVATGVKKKSDSIDSLIPDRMAEKIKADAEDELGLPIDNVDEQ